MTYTLPGTNIKVQCSAQKHDPLFAIAMFYAATPPTLGMP